MKAVPLLLLYLLGVVSSLNFFGKQPLVAKMASSSPRSIAEPSASWDVLQESVLSTSRGSYLEESRLLRATGEGPPHTDNELRLFGSKDEPRVTFFKDRASWCPYCQKVWILLEEKKIPHRVEKINMRSYGDKPQEFMRMVPNGLLPAIKLDGRVQTESLEIMLNLDATFTGPSHKPMWPAAGSAEAARAQQLMRLERSLFSDWCGLVFRPSMGSRNRDMFERTMDEVNSQLTVVDSSPWFLKDLSIVDLTYVTHIERMCASVAFWSGFKVRGDGRWPAIERWLDAFEALPSYMATKSDYYTHVQDIPPQYGPGYAIEGSQAQANMALINGQDGSWSLPLPPFAPSDLEPVSPAIDPGEEAARHEAAFKLCLNHENIVKFACRGPGSVGAKRFQAPLADPYAVPNLDYQADVDALLRITTMALLQGSPLPELGASSAPDAQEREALVSSLEYLRDRIGVPRDMSYPAARQLRAFLNYRISILSG